MSGGSAEPALNFVAAAFQKKTGHAVKIAYNTGAGGRKRVEDGEAFDVLVVASDSLKRNWVGNVEEGGISIGRLGGLGMMVRAGVPLPNISSVEALKRALLEAESVLYTEETSGLYIEGMLKKMGIYEQVEAKTTRYRNGPSLMDRVLNGTGKEFGFLSVNAIGTYKEKGLVLVGPLPEEVQYYYELIAAPLTRSKNKEVAWEFVRFCGGPGKPLLAANGIK
jgi:molybdate transport system substrate-binding protein